MCQGRRCSSDSRRGNRRCSKRIRFAHGLSRFPRSRFRVVGLGFRLSRFPRFRCSWLSLSPCLARKRHFLICFRFRVLGLEGILFCFFILSSPDKGTQTMGGVQAPNIYLLFSLYQKFICALAKKLCAHALNRVWCCAYGAVHMVPSCLGLLTSHARMHARTHARTHARMCWLACMRALNPKP